MMLATSSHTSGGGWNRHGSTATITASTSPLSDPAVERVERQQDDGVHERGEHQPGDEDPSEQAAVESQMHEEHRHGRELDDHRDDEDHRVHAEVQVDVVEGDLGA